MGIEIILIICYNVGTYGGIMGNLEKKIKQENHELKKHFILDFIADKLSEKVINPIIEYNLKKRLLREGEKLEDFSPVKDCKLYKKSIGKVYDEYLKLYNPDKVGCYEVNKVFSHNHRDYIEDTIVHTQHGPLILTERRKDDCLYVSLQGFFRREENGKPAKYEYNYTISKYCLKPLVNSDFVWLNFLGYLKTYEDVNDDEMINALEIIYSRMNLPQIEG